MFSVLPTMPMATMTRSNVLLASFASLFDKSFNAISRFYPAWRDLGAGQDRHALLFEGFARKYAEISSSSTGRMRSWISTTVTARAERVEKAGKFDADGARPHHQQVFRHLCRDLRFLVGPDELAIRLQPRQHPCPRAGSEERMRRSESLRSAGHPWSPRSCGHPSACRCPSNTVILVFLQQGFHPRRQLRGYIARERATTLPRSKRILSAASPYSSR